MTFAGSFDDWLRRSEEAIALVQKAGLKAAKRPIDAAAFLLWCAGKGLPVDGASVWGFAYRNFSAELLRTRSSA